MKLPYQKQTSGFALVATVSVMVLLVMIALAMLSLSSISIREHNHTSAQDEAKANARMALMIALGELQQQLGPDQRISAPASILDTNKATKMIDGVKNPGWLGVWNAKPESSDLTYESGRKNSFRSWLVSLGDNVNSSSSPDDATDDTVFDLGTNLTLTDSNSVILGKPDADNIKVRAVLTGINSGRGKYAWHIGDNSMRARANIASENPVDTASMIARRGAVDRHSPEVVSGLEDFPSDKENLKKVISSGSVPLLLAPDKRNQNASSHALTSDSVSLMTNVVSGGWRKDINTLFEQTGAATFENLGYGVWEGSTAKDSSEAYLYGPQFALGARWNQLHTFYNLYNRLSFDSNGVPEIRPKASLIDWNLADQQTDFGDEGGGFAFPRVAKIVYLFSYASRKLPDKTSEGETHVVQIVTDILVTLWNPYNARIVFPPNTCMFIKFSKGIPLRFTWYLDDADKGNHKLDKLIVYDDTGTLTRAEKRDDLIIQSAMYIKKPSSLFVMEPGETIVMSPNKETPDRRGVTHEYEPGRDRLETVHGRTFDLSFKPDSGGESITIKGKGTASIKVGVEPDDSADAYNIENKDGSKSVTSQYCDYWIYDNARNWPFYEHRGEIIAENNVSFTQVLPSIDKDDVVSRTVGAVEGKENKQPFAAFTVELKTAKDAKNPNMAFMHSGLSRLSSRLGAVLGEWNTERMDYRLELISNFNDPIIDVTVGGVPGGPGPNHGYIGAGRLAASGVTHVMQSALPLLPMTSLAEFQHAGVGDGAAVIRATHWRAFSTPLPPFMDYAVGNSYAHPLIDKNSKQTGDYYDHSYHANELLWDHYFCSSLTPQTQSIFDEPREMQNVWRDFLTSGRPMLNPRYRPYFGSKTENDLEAEVFSGDSLETEAFKSIASHLLYEGGFNVNSTSVEAWKAFLSGARQDQLRIIANAHLPGASAATETAKGTPFSRTKLPLGSSIDDSTSDLQLQYLGYRDLSDAQIITLAEKIVEQVKTRGPFLSLGDFINRQLSDDVDLAKRGALQAAIDNTDINEEVANTGVQVNGTDKGFNFAEAAAGNSATGSPGWLMQGDLLTPLGPSIFVRGDTFTIRAYGDARDNQGNVLATAYCEAVVQRVPDYIDSADERDIYPPVSAVNTSYGRKFEILQFRWINPNEF